MHIWQTSGVYGLYQGHTATLLRVFPYAAIKFVAYDQIRDHLIPSLVEEVWYRRIAAGSLAGNSLLVFMLIPLGLTSVFFTYPLEVVRVRLAFETQNSARISFPAICSRIYHERDKPVPMRIPPTESLPSAAIAQPPSIPRPPLVRISNFYRGFTATIVGMIPYAGVSFWAHDTVGDVLRSKSFAPFTLANVEPRNERELRHPKLKNQWEAVAGGLAGLLAQTSSYPIEVVRRRMQVGGAVGNHEMKGAWQTVKSVYSAAGMRGFYIGLSIGYIKVLRRFFRGLESNDR